MSNDLKTLMGCHGKICGPCEVEDRCPIRAAFDHLIERVEILETATREWSSCAYVTTRRADCPIITKL